MMFATHGLIVFLFPFLVEYSSGDNEFEGEHVSDEEVPVELEKISSPEQPLESMLYYNILYN